MRQKRAAGTGGGEKTIRDIRRATRRQYSAEEKIRIVLDGLRGEDSIAERGTPNSENRYTVARLCFSRDSHRGTPLSYLHFGYLGLLEQHIRSVWALEPRLPSVCYYA